MAAESRPQDQSDDQHKAYTVDGKQRQGMPRQVREQVEAAERDEAEKKQENPVVPEALLTGLRERIGDPVKSAPARDPLGGEFCGLLIEVTGVGIVEQVADAGGDALRPVG